MSCGVQDEGCLLVCLAGLKPLIDTRLTAGAASTPPPPPRCKIQSNRFFSSPSPSLALYFSLIIYNSSSQLFVAVAERCSAGLQGVSALGFTAP